MFLSLKANKKRVIAFIILAALVVGVCLFLKNGKKADVQEQFASTNEERVAFLKGFGWDVESNPMETREVMIPEVFNDVYTEYNKMQKSQGYDLKPYAGYRCMQYKYMVKNYPEYSEVIATILVYDGKVLGGDLACAEVDGFMHGFARDSQYYGGKKPENVKSDDSNEVVSRTEANSTENTQTEESNAVSEMTDTGNEDVSIGENSTAAEDVDNTEGADADVTGEADETAAEVNNEEDVFPTD